MMRVCHLGTCPFGIATQDPKLRKRFVGKPEYVERFMRFIAAQLREIMARLGARTVEQLVGRADLLKVKEGAPIDLSALLGFSRNTCCRPGCAYDLHLEDRADKRGRRALTTADRAFGATLAGRRGYRGLRLRRAGFRRLFAAGTEDHLAWRGQRLPWQGPFPAARWRCARPRARIGTTATRSSATSPSTARPAAKPISPARRASASACAIPER